MLTRLPQDLSEAERAIAAMAPVTAASLQPGPRSPESSGSTVSPWASGAIAAIARSASARSSGRRVSRRSQATTLPPSDSDPPITTRRASAR